MISRRSLLALGVSALLTAGIAATSSAAPKKHILVVTHTAGFRHDSIPTAEKVLAEIGEKSGIYTVDYCRTADDVKQMLVPDYLKKYDAVFFANTTGNLGIPNLQAFLDWIKAGHAFLGAHSATDTYKRGDTGGDMAYVAMIGGEFAGHGKQCEVDCLVQDPKHPAVSHLGTDWKVFDEIYHFGENSRLHNHVLLYLDKNPDDGRPDANQPADDQIAWCSMYGKGRVFYTALGHRIEVWNDPKYQQHILGAIKWALGLAKGSATPGPMLTGTPAAK